MTTRSRRGAPTWTSAASVAGDDRALTVLANPAIPVERRAEVADRAARRPDLDARPEPHPAAAPARPDRGAAARRRGVPPPRRPPPGHHPRHRDQRRAAHAGRGPRAHRATRTDHRRPHRARGAGRSEPARRPHRPRRRPPDRRQRPWSPRATPRPARLGRPLGDTQHGHPIRRDHQHHQVRHRLVRLGCRDAQRRHGRRGR